MFPRMARHTARVMPPEPSNETRPKAGPPADLTHKASGAQLPYTSSDLGLVKRAARKRGR